MTAIVSVVLSSDPGPDQTYAIGDMVSATVTFTEAMTVDDMGGTNKPELALDFDGKPKAASYASGTGTTALVFSYEVADGDEDADGIAIGADKLALNGGTITGGGVRAAELTHGSADTT